MSHMKPMCGRRRKTCLLDDSTLNSSIENVSRRDVAEYVRNVPPHVQAARQLKAPGKRIEYVITKSGPQPASLIRAPLDYQHYLERQLAPAAQSLLHFLGG